MRVQKSGCISCQQRTRGVERRAPIGFDRSLQRGQLIFVVSVCLPLPSSLAYAYTASRGYPNQGYHGPQWRATTKHMPGLVEGHLGAGVIISLIDRFSTFARILPLFEVSRDLVRLDADSYFCCVERVFGPRLRYSAHLSGWCFRIGQECGEGYKENRRSLGIHFPPSVN